MTLRILIPATIEKIEEKREVMGSWTDPDTKETIYQYRDLGWFMLLSGSKEWLHIGYEPVGGFKPGDKVTITIERTP